MKLTSLSERISKMLAKPPAEPETGQRFRGHYVEWRAKRLLAILNHYGPSSFLGKTVLEVGCGHGDIGGVLSGIGATVTCSDARAEHLAVVRGRFPEITTVLADLDQDWPDGDYDFTVHMGVLYHLRDFRGALRRACERCRRLILETEVVDSDDPACVVETKERGYDQAKNGVGVRPSAAAIEGILDECGMDYVRIMDSRCNTAEHRYDWPVTNSGEWRNGLRRFWFAERR